jgi:transcriptional regulator with XRE-family HTH domain
MTVATWISPPPTPVAELRRRRELANFLRFKRERLDPASVGLSSHSRRRVRGLRREEVAERAGISASWYTWLEQ